LNQTFCVRSNSRQGVNRAHLARLPALDPALAPPSHISLKVSYSQRIYRPFMAAFNHILTLRFRSRQADKSGGL
jgi:hypothetical protein